MTSRRVAWIVSLSAAALLSGCAARAQAPDEVAREFLRQIYLGERERAWEMVHPEDQRLIASVRQDLERAGVDAPPDHELLLLRRISSPYAIKGASVEGRAEAAKGARAVVRMSFRDGRTERAVLDHDGTQWRVRLSVPPPESAEKTHE